MQFCTEVGLPHSKFLEWSVEDRMKTVAFLLEKADRCALCGTAQWEWEENKRAYQPVEHHCPGCYLKHVAGEEQAMMPGTTIRLVSSNSPELAKAQAKAKKAYEDRHRGGRS